MSLSPQIFLFCLRGPEIGAGGETVLAKTRELTQRLDYGVKQKFERLGVRYQATLPNKDPDMKQVQKAWQDRFLTNDPQVTLLGLPTNVVLFYYKNLNFYNIIKLKKLY